MGATGRNALGAYLMADLTMIPNVYFILKSVDWFGAMAIRFRKCSNFSCAGRVFVYWSFQKSSTLRSGHNSIVFAISQG